MSNKKKEKKNGKQSLRHARSQCLAVGRRYRAGVPAVARRSRRRLPKLHLLATAAPPLEPAAAHACSPWQTDAPPLGLCGVEERVKLRRATGFGDVVSGLRVARLRRRQTA